MIYPLDEILVLCLLAVLGGAETFVDIARFGEKKLGLLRRFRPFRDGTPAHDHLGDIFATPDAQAFRRCFVAWVAALIDTPAEVIAIDGKTLRRSYQKKGAKAPIHMFSAFAARQRLVLGQIKVADKSNEIVAIPKLLEMMVIEGAIVAIDPRELSGGMQQRASICRALIHDPWMLLMDEPFAALDAMTREEIGFELLRIWDTHKKTVIFVPHHIPEAILLADRVVAMSPRPGRIAKIINVDIPRPRTLAMEFDRMFKRYSDEIRAVIYRTPRAQRA